MRPCSSHGAAVQAAHLDGRHRTDQAACQGGRGAHEAAVKKSTTEVSMTVLSDLGGRF